MTDPIVRLETPQLTVEPGGQARTLVTVRNLGTIVEGFRMKVVGEGAADWAEVTPPEVQVYPDQEATAVVVFSPPAGAGTPSGSFPYGLHAESVVDASTSAVAEGDLEIGRVFGLQAKLTPVSSSGRWRGKHFIELTNWGNAPVHLRITASDPDEKLAYLIGPEILDLPLGVTGHLQLRVKTKAPFLRGTQTRSPFQVVAQPDPPETPTGPPSPIPDPRRAVVDGAFLQKPILSKLTVVAALVAVLALGGGVAYALTRESDSGPTGLAQGPPRTPELSVVTKDAASIQLLWQGQPNLESYRVHQLTPDGNTTGVQTVDGALNAFAVEGLEAQTEYCFKLEAVRAGQSSPLSAQQCAVTGVAPATTAPSTAVASPSVSESPTVSSEPTVVSESPTLSPTAPSSPQVTSGPPGDPGGTGTAGVPGGPGVPGVPGVPGGPGGPGGTVSPTTGGAPGGTTAGQPGGPATTAVTPPPTGGTAPGTFASTQFIGVVFAVPAADAQAEPRAEAKRQQLVGAGIAASILRTAAYPDLRFGQSSNPPVDAYLVYVGPFDSAQAVSAFCGQQPTLLTPCLPVRPSPQG